MSGHTKRLLEALTAEHSESCDGDPNCYHCHIIAEVEVYLSKPLGQGVSAILPGPMGTKHTPEPWDYAGYCEDDSCYHIGQVGDVNISGMRVDDNHSISKLVADVWAKNKDDDEGRTNARRIVACVNACAGLSTDTLETFTTTVPSGIVYHLEQGNRERDELKAQLARVKAITVENLWNCIHNLEADMSDMERIHRLLTERMKGKS